MRIHRSSCSSALSTAVYGYLLLRMQGKEVSAETLEGIKQISSFLALLAEKYREDMKGELKLED